MTLDDIRARCVMRDGHWIFRGARTNDGFPKLWAPDYTNGGRMTAQIGRRAVWHVATRQPIAPGHRVWGTCECRDCLRPDHMHCGSMQEWGAHMAEIGIHKNSVARKIDNYRRALKLCKMTPAQVLEVQASSETGRALSQRMGIRESTISKARRGQLLVHPAGAFAGLMR